MERPARVVFVGGLPGSGKSHLLRELACKGYHIFDDFQAQARGNSPRFTKARCYPELLRVLREGRQCVVADVRVVTAEYRADAQRALLEEFTVLELEWRIFDKEPEQCKENIRRSEEGRLEVLRQFSGRHSVPGEIVPIPVWRKPS